MPADTAPPPKQPEKKPEPPKEEDDGELTEYERVAYWNFHRLVDDLKLPVEDALNLIKNPYFDWHDAKDLVDRGVPPNRVASLL